MNKISSYAEGLSRLAAGECNTKQAAMITADNLLRILKNVKPRIKPGASKLELPEPYSWVPKKRLNTYPGTEDAVTLGGRMPAGRGPERIEFFKSLV